MSTKFTFASLFSGAMGLDLGLEEAGGACVFANEIDKGAIATMRLNRPEMPIFDDSIENLTQRKFTEMSGIAAGELDLLAGGPPCQSFSVYGNREGTLDPRGQMVFEYLRMVRELKPKTFLMENVRGLHSMPLVPKKRTNDVNDFEIWMSEKGSLLQELLKGFTQAGYQAQAFLVNSANYGAPQIRERLMILGNRLGGQASMPKPTHSNRPEDRLPPFTSLRDVIGKDFCDPCPELMNFSARKLRYLSMVPPGGNWRSLPVDIQKESMGKSWYLKGGRSATWRRLSWDFPSPTVVTMPNHASTSMCHPDDLRALTVGECAAIQEFPSDWKFAGTTAEKYRQIGNAVPVRLGKVAGDAIAKLLCDTEAQAPTDFGIPSEAHNAPDVIHIRPHIRTKRYWHKGEALAGNHSYYDDDLRLFA
ncbi:DNA cytosine methyltransferase [Novosphingobium sp. ZN18A2]|uniref:DNA cytosine methyltransferase n=1 Tax=Novosphingobium sp. ZN18A2 TaxID=3079861 RepID=UPI0030CAEEFC